MISTPSKTRIATFFRSLGGCAVAPRGHADDALESTPHGLGAAEAAAGADRFETVVAVLEHAARGFDPHRGDETGRRHSDFAPEHAREVAWAHRHATRERLDRM